MKMILTVLAMTFSICLNSGPTVLLGVKKADEYVKYEVMKGASCSVFELEKEPWIKVSLSARKYSLAAFTVPRGNKVDYYGTPRDPVEVPNLAMAQNIWSGNDTFSFDYYNPEKTEQQAAVWFFDRGSIASFCTINDMMKEMLNSESPDPAPKYMQMGEVMIKMKPGRGTAVVDLKKDILTVDKQRAIDLSDVRMYALKGLEKGSLFYVNNIRLEGRDGEAGILPSVAAQIICPDTKKGYHDVYAPICPYCGKKSHRQDGTNNEPAAASGSIKVQPDVAAGYGARGGGGNDQTDGVVPLGIAHYDFGFWENRALLSFNLLGKVPGGSRIKKAEIRAYAKDPGKPFFPVMEVYSVPERFKPDPKKKIVWNSQPPVESLLFISGVYDGADSPRWFTYDVTPYFSGKQRSAAAFQIRAAISASTHDNPHPKGHYLLYETVDRSKKPYLYIELE